MPGKPPQSGLIADSRLRQRNGSFGELPVRLRGSHVRLNDGIPTVRRARQRFRSKVFRDEKRRRIVSRELIRAVMPRHGRVRSSISMKSPRRDVIKPSMNIELLQRSNRRRITTRRCRGVAMRYVRRERARRNVRRTEEVEEVFEAAWGNHADHFGERIGDLESVSGVWGDGAVVARREDAAFACVVALRGPEVEAAAEAVEVLKVGLVNLGSIVIENCGRLLVAQALT